MKILKNLVVAALSIVILTGCAQANSQAATEASPDAQPAFTLVPPTKTPAPTRVPPTPTPIPVGFSEGAEMGKIEEVRRFGLGSIYESGYSPDGGTIAYASSFGMYLFDPQKKQMRDFIPASGEAQSVSFSSDGEWMAYGTTLGEVVVWGMKDNRQVVVLAEHQAAVNNLVFSPDNQFLVSSDEAGRLNVFQTGDWARLKTHELGFVYDFEFLPDGSKLLVSAHNWGIVSLDSNGWGMLNQIQVVKIENRNYLLTAESIAIFPDGELMAVALEHTPAIPVIEISSGATHSILPVNPSQAGGSARVDIYALDISKDGKYLCFVGQGGTGLVDLENNGKLIQFLNKGGKVNKIAFSPKGNAVSMGAVTMDMRKWNFEYPLHSSSQNEIDLLGSVNPEDGRKNFKDAALFASENWELEINGETGDIALKKRGAGQPLFTANAHTPIPFSAFGQTAYMAKITAAAADDDSFFVTGGADKALKLWTTTANPEPRLLGTLKNGADEIAVSPDAKWVAVRDVGSALYLFQSAGESQPVYLGRFQQADKIAFSPDGKLLAASVNKAHVMVWNVSGEKPVVSFEADQSKRLNEDSFVVNILAFSPDGKVLATGGSEAQINIWRVADGNLLAVLDNRTWVTRMQFSDDGTTLYVDGQTDVRWWGVKQ